MWQGRAGDGRAQHDSIDNLSPSLWLLAWLGSALAEVFQYYLFTLYMVKIVINVWLYARIVFGILPFCCFIHLTYCVFFHINMVWMRSINSCWKHIISKSCTINTILFLICFLHSSLKRSFFCSTVEKDVKIWFSCIKFDSAISSSSSMILGPVLNWEVLNKRNVLMSTLPVVKPGLSDSL